LFISRKTLPIFPFAGDASLLLGRPDWEIEVLRRSRFLRVLECNFENGGVSSSELILASRWISSKNAWSTTALALFLGVLFGLGAGFGIEAMMEDRNRF
jgi:hypothetical protein